MVDFDLSRVALPAVILLAATSLTILASHRWRYCLFALVLQYAGVFTLVALSWPIALAAVKVITGWMVTLVLGTSILTDDSYQHLSGKVNRLGVHRSELGSQPGGAFFRILAAGLVGMVISSTAPRVVDWIPGVQMEQVWGGLVLIGIGLLQLGLTAQPLRVVLGLLTVMSGFEILYASIESATLVVGLLAGVNLALALIGAYLLVSPSLEESG